MYLTDQYWNLEDSIETVIDYINKNDGLTTVGWYTHGLINDQSIIAGSDNNQRNAQTKNNENQVDGGPINYRLCYIQPLNRKFFSTNFNIGHALLYLKLDVSYVDLIKKRLK